MNARIFASILLSLVCTKVALADDVYHWVDEAGVSQYGDRPGTSAANKIRVREHKQAVDIREGEGYRSEMRRRTLEDFQRDKELEAEQAGHVANQRRLMALRCRQLELRWNALEHPGPIFYENRGGERQFLDDDQRAGERDKLRPDLRKYCGKAPDE